MPIIIETPAPPTRERLVLVSSSSVSNPIETPNGEVFTVRTTEARDATAADLARGGWVPRLIVDGLRVEVADERARAEKAEASLRMSVTPAHAEAIERAEKAERERDEAVKESAGALRSAMVERDTLRDEVARLTAPVEGEPSGAELLAMFERTPDLNDLRMRAVWRAGVAHERTRHAQPEAQGRATDGDLLAMAADAYRLRSHVGPSLDDLRKLALAVAARVRQEPGLVERLVGDPRLDSVSVDAVMGGAIRVRVVRRVDSLANTLGTPQEAYCSRADVPATLARLAGLEVSRG